MGQYFNPAPLLKEVGSPISMESDISYRDLTWAADGRLVFGIWFRLDMGFYNAPYLYSEHVYNEFRHQEDMGLLRFEGYYSLDKDTARDHGIFC